MNYYWDKRRGELIPEYRGFKTSFAKQISDLSNFSNVSVAGQRASSFPSLFTNYRLNSENGSDNFIDFIGGKLHFQITYLVGGVRLRKDWNLNEQNIAFPIQYNKNGRTTCTEFQTGV